MARDVISAAVDVDSVGQRIRYSPRVLRRAQAVLAGYALEQDEVAPDVWLSEVLGYLGLMQTTTIEKEPTE